MSDNTHEHNEHARRAAGPTVTPRGRSRFIRRLLMAALVTVILGPAVLAFVFVAVIPAVRVTRQAGLESPAAAERTTERPSQPKVLARDESPRLLGFDEAYWKSRLSLAKQDAISLSVDLVDSTATLDIRGVPVRTCRLRRIEMSGAVRHLETTRAFRERLSKPLVIQNETATLPKEPIRVEIAPKDTIEALQNAARPLAPEEVDVYFTLVLDDGLELAVEQLEEPSTPDGRRKKRRMDMSEYLHQAKKAIRSLIRSEFPQHELKIEVTLTREDAKAIYRALGPKARVALRL